ncbi:hypothetical protein [Nodosilinea sp. E11]|uniref:hypothetical protein n=1 Tax=Nodosilinea sp. E11 TaxID=3037479 RepID=UPI002934DBB8|nr:hypothetical protein [Nodosilinea sp. E11]WOD38432.1 hypothetical protein RRF56_19675 [Nodosilinea sp. E11]
MTKPFASRPGLATSLVLGALLTCCISRPVPSATSDPRPSAANAEAALPPTDLWYEAVGEANQATLLAATATTAPQWNQVAGAWGRSVALLQAIAPDDPRQVFSQRKAREYQQNLYLAQQKADQQGLPRVFPALGSDVLDEQVSLYHAYVATLGPPDVLVVGSSRALQGVDPVVLQQALAAQGYPGLRVYNFSVNGATAQVVSFITRQLLAPDLHPRLVIWAEGSRAFNSGRFDRTFAEILASPGYAAVRDGATLTLASPNNLDQAEPASDDSEPDSPELDSPESEAIAPNAEYGTVPLSPINSQGFLAVNDQFNPTVYYRSFPLVRGQYDNAYRPFRLDGVQTVSFEATTQFLQSQNIPLVFVNLPLSNDYLDGVRLNYERQFQQFLQGWANRGTLTLVDLLETWRWRSHLFADPSHINRYGAREIASLLAADGRIPWGQLVQAQGEE